VFAKSAIVSFLDASRKGQRPGKVSETSFNAMCSM
jgi:hypothetical protein